MKNWNGLKTKVEEQKNWMKNSNGWTQHVHNQELCANVNYNLFTTKGFVSKNITCSSPRGMFPLGIETIWSHTFSIPFHIFYVWIQTIKSLTSKIIFATWRRKLFSFPHLHPNLLALVFLRLPSTCDCYTFFNNGKTQICRNGHTKHFKTMIEYTLISSKLDRICKMTTKPLEYPRDPTLLDPLKNLLEIRIWGTKWKRQIDKTTKWAAWGWTNAKIDKESLTLFKEIVNIPNENMEDYHWAMFTHATEFFQECTSFKKPIPKHFFTSLL